MPSYRFLLYKEGQLIENLTAFTLLITFLISLRFKKVFSNQRKKLLHIISIISILGFLDEISYGGLSIALKLPNTKIYNIDGLHDFLDIIKIFLYKLINSNLENSSLILITFISLIILIIIKFQKINHKIIYILKKFRILNFSILALFFISIATFIDVFPYGYKLPITLKILEENFEMYFAFSLLTITIILKKTYKKYFFYQSDI